MDERYAAHYYEMEGAHAWSVTRRDVVERLLKRFGVGATDMILDAGCSGGALLAQLSESGYRNLRGVDMSPLAVEYCRSRGIDGVSLGDAAAPALSPGSVDCVVASDILEHIEDDAGALANWRTLLSNNGLLICFVPAFQFLWSEHDVLNHHVRRYMRSELVELVQQQGYRVVDSGYWNFTLFAPVALSRLAERGRAALSGAKPPASSSGAFKPLNRPVNALLTRMLVSENRALIRGVRAPFGISAFVVARRS